MKLGGIDELNSAFDLRLKELVSDLEFMIVVEEELNGSFSSSKLGLLSVFALRRLYFGGYSGLVMIVKLIAIHIE